MLPAHYFPRDMIESPSLGVLKMQLNRVLDSLILPPFSTKGWTRWSFEIPSKVDCCMIPCWINILSKVELLQNSVKSCHVSLFLLKREWVKIFHFWTKACHQDYFHSLPEICCFCQSNSYRDQFGNYPVYLSFLCNVNIFMNLWQIQGCSVIVLRLQVNLQQN